MKKLVLIIAVMFGASMVACSSSEKANDAANEANDAVEAVVEEVTEVAVACPGDSTCACDSCVCDSCAKAAPAAQN